ncbi:MAG TPA: sigma-70 region 4 domain-containing protein [Clostridia bacterium]
MNSVYIKAMLDCFKHLDKLADALDKKAMDIALKSSGFDGNFRPATHYVRAITDLTNQKIDLINIKVIILDMINRLPYRYRLAARYRYIDNLKIREIAQKLNASSRSVFRLLEKVPAFCQEYLEKNGLDDQWFIENFANKKWMSKYLKNMEDKPIDKKQKAEQEKPVIRNYSQNFVYIVQR